MSVDSKAIDDMARIMSLLDGQAPSVEKHHSPQAPTASSSSGDPGIEAMKNILLKLQEAAGPTVHRLHEQSHNDVELRSALQTEVTTKGARVGGWEIIVNEGTHRSYDVVNVATEQPIAKDLYLYEAAYGLVKRLNEGVAINDQRIRNLLTLEEEYAKNRDDAAVYKKQQKRLRESGENDRAAVAEDRFDEAKRRAEDAQERLLKLAGLR